MGVPCKKVLELTEKNGDGLVIGERGHRKEESWVHIKSLCSSQGWG